MNQDSVWKEAVETYFEEFMHFFFSDIAKDIDFEKGYEFLDKELEKTSQDAKIGKKLVDILVKVYLGDGLEKWLLIHIEVQGYYEKEFAKRMFIYNYRIFDRYNKDVISLAVLADTSPSFRDNIYERNYWGFELKFKFPIVKILDYQKKWKELEKVQNPFAIIVMAHLKDMETKKNINNRLFWKVTLIKSLYQKGYAKNDILLLYKFIDWLVNLPKELSKKFDDEIIKYEEEKKMPYITTAEKIGIEKGIQQGIQQGIRQGIQQGIRQGLLKAIKLGLELKFGTEGLRIYPKIKKIEDADILEAIGESIRLAKDVADIERIYSKEV